jgi:hypothetical protein
MESSTGHFLLHPVPLHPGSRVALVRALSQDVLLRSAQDDLSVFEHVDQDGASTALQGLHPASLQDLHGAFTCRSMGMAFQVSGGGSRPRLKLPRAGNAKGPLRVGADA